MSFKYNPVRVLALAVAALTALLGASQIPVDGHPLLPPAVAAWCAVVLAVLTAVGGELARGQVTPLARPTAADGETPLVPLRAPSLSRPADQMPTGQSGA